MRILIRAGDFVEDTRRRQRRRVLAGVLVGIGAVVIAGSPTPPATAPSGTSGTSTLASAVTTTQTSAGASAVVTPPSMQFPQLTVGNASAAQLFTIRNPGSEAMEVRSVAATDAAFLTTNGCDETLAARESCTIAVVFSPSKPGQQAGSMAVETSAGTFAIPLRGEAKPAPVPVDLASSKAQAPCPPAPAPKPDPVVAEAAPLPTSIPTFTENSAKAVNNAAIQAAQAQLRNVRQVSLTGTTDPPSLMEELREKLELNGLQIVDKADVGIHFEATLSRGQTRRRFRSADAIISRGGKPVIRYVLPAEDYRVGDNPSEAFNRAVLRRVFNR